MKDKIKSFFKGTVKTLCLGLIGAAVSLATGPNADAQTYGASPTSVTNVTGSTTNVFANVLSYTSTNVYLFDCTQKGNYAFSVTYTPTVTNSQTTTFYFYQCLDGTTNTLESVPYFSIVGTNVNQTNTVTVVSNLVVNGVGWLAMNKVTSTLTNAIVGPGQTTNSFPRIYQAIKPGIVGL